MKKIFQIEELVKDLNYVLSFLQDDNNVFKGKSYRNVAKKPK